MTHFYSDAKLPSLVYRTGTDGQVWLGAWFIGWRVSTALTADMMPRLEQGDYIIAIEPDEAENTMKNPWERPANEVAA